MNVPLYLQKKEHDRCRRPGGPRYVQPHPAASVFLVPGGTVWNPGDSQREEAAVSPHQTQSP